MTKRDWFHRMLYTPRQIEQSPIDNFGGLGKLLKKLINRPAWLQAGNIIKFSKFRAVFNFPKNTKYSIFPRATAAVLTYQTGKTENFIFVTYLLKLTVEKTTK